MPNSVRQQPSTGGRQNTNYVPPNTSDVDSDDDLPPFSDEEGIENTRYTRPSPITPDTASMTPAYWLMGLVIIVGAIYFLFAQPTSNVTTITATPTAPTTQTQPAPAPAPAANNNDTGALPAAPKASDATGTPPAATDSSNPPAKTAP